MKQVSGLGRASAITAAVLLVVTAAAMVFALTAAGRARADGQTLSGRLVPAGVTAAGLATAFTTQQSAMREYVYTRQPAALRTFQQMAREIPGMQRQISDLSHDFPPVTRQSATVAAALQAWRIHFAGPELAAAARGDYARALFLQNRFAASLRYSLPARHGIGTLQTAIARAQTTATARLVTQQRYLLAGLLLVGALVVLTAAGLVLTVRRWLLVPLATVRSAAETVAAGDYGNKVPAVGPAELAALGRAAEQMRKRLADALAEAATAEKRFRALFESAPDAAVLAAQDGSVVMANSRAERMFGYGANALVGQPLEILVAPAEREGHLRRRASLFAAPEEVVAGTSVSLTMVDRENQEIPAEISVSMLPTETGVMLCASIRDVSERLHAEAEQDRLHAMAEANQKSFERRLQQSERMESLGRLVGGVAHDFNNLLSVITGYTDFIAEQLADMVAEHQPLEGLLTDLGEVRLAADRAATLTGQLLAFGRRDVIHPVSLNLGKVVAGIEQLLRRTLGDHIDLIVSAEPGSWPVLADLGQVEQILVNLAVNARDAMPTGGKLAIDVDNVTEDGEPPDSQPSQQRPLPPGRYTRLRVSDSGSGMAQETIDRAFEPFFTTKPEGQGTGLGLATVYGIVSRAGGHITISSEPGFGTNVSVLLPATTIVSSAAEPETATLEPGHGELILLTENEQSLWQLTERILTGHGYRVCTARTPAEAMRQASDRHQHIDLLLTDVVMPEMLGHELATRVRAVCPGIPVLYMSGYARQVLDSQGALEPGVDLLGKPFGQATLLSRVRRAIDAHQPSSVGPVASGVRAAQE